MITDSDLSEAYAAGSPELPASTSGLRAVQNLVVREMLREIEAIEEGSEGIRANSVLPHLVGIDLGAAHERDRQVARHVAHQLSKALVLEVTKLSEGKCDGKIETESVVELFDMLSVG